MMESGAQLWRLFVVGALAAVAVASAAPSSTEAAADDDWELLGDRYYRLVRRHMTAAEARSYCAALGKGAKLIDPGRAEAFKYFSPFWVFTPSTDERALAMTRAGTMRMSPNKLTANFICESREKVEKSSACPPGCVYNPRSGFCYRLIQEVQTWARADEECSRIGASVGLRGDLATAGNDREKKFLQELGLSRKADFIWVGAMGSSSDRTKWHWLGGSSFTGFSAEGDGSFRPMGNRRIAYLNVHNGRWYNHHADRAIDSEGTAAAICKLFNLIDR